MKWIQRNARKDHAQHLALMAKNVFAAAASVSGHALLPSCAAASPIARMHVWGMTTHSTFGTLSHAVMYCAPQTCRPGCSCMYMEVAARESHVMTGL